MILYNKSTKIKTNYSRRRHDIMAQLRPRRRHTRHITKEPLVILCVYKEKDVILNDFKLVKTEGTPQNHGIRR